MSGSAFCGVADHVACADAHIGERDFRRAQAILGRIAAARDARRLGVDQKQADARAVALPTRGARRDDELVGRIAVQHDALLAVDDPSVAVALRRGGDVGKVVARLALGMGEGEPQAAVGDLRQQVVALLVAAAEADESAAEHDRREIGLQRERAAERLHDDHGLDRPAAEAAVLLPERQAEQTKLGILRPELRAPAFRALAVALARFEVVAVRQQPLDTVLEQALLFAEVEVHQATSLVHGTAPHLPCGERSAAERSRCGATADG